MTDPSCECEYENAPKPSCHENRPNTHFELLINMDESLLITATRSESATVGFNPIKRCKWSGIIDGDKLLMLMRHDSSDIFLKPIVVPSFYQTLPSFHSEDNVNINLGKCVRHRIHLT